MSKFSAGMLLVSKHNARPRTLLVRVVGERGNICEVGTWFINYEASNTRDFVGVHPEEQDRIGTQVILSGRGMNTVRSFEVETILVDADDNRVDSIQIEE